MAHTGKEGAGKHGSAASTSGQGRIHVRFVDCPARKVDFATLTKSGSGQGQEQLSLEQHTCGDPRCKVPHDGNFTRGLKDIKARTLPKKISNYMEIVLKLFGGSR